MFVIGRSLERVQGMVKEVVHVYAQMCVLICIYVNTCTYIIGGDV